MRTAQAIQRAKHRPQQSIQDKRSKAAQAANYHTERITAKAKILRDPRNSNSWCIMIPFLTSRWLQISSEAAIHLLLIEGLRINKFTIYLNLVFRTFLNHSEPTLRWALTALRRLAWPVSPTNEILWFVFPVRYIAFWATSLANVCPWYFLQTAFPSRLALLTRFKNTSNPVSRLNFNFCNYNLPIPNSNQSKWRSSNSPAQPDHQTSRSNKSWRVKYHSWEKW